MADHSYTDAPLWTVLNALANMPGGECRIIDLAPRVITTTGHPGAYRAIGRIVASGYAVVEGPFPEWPDGTRRKYATIRITDLGRQRWRQGADYVGQLGVVRAGTDQALNQRKHRYAGY